MSEAELNLQPYEWSSSDRDNSYSIRVWTHNRESERVLLRIEDYQPFCRIELPSIVSGNPVKWTFDALKVYAQWLRNILGNHAPTRIIFKELRKIYWYRDGTKYPFFTCYFQTEEAMRHCVQLINKSAYLIDKLGLIKSRVWETNITVIHRLVTDINVGYGQWFKVKANSVPELDKISSNKHEYIASYKDLVALPPEETEGWNVKPWMAAIDIETYSTNHRSMPNQNYIKDCAFQISYILQQMGRPETRKKYLLVLGDCDDIPGAEVIRYDHEIRMIDGLIDLINKTDPSILTGYNIFKYDFPYLDARMKLYLREWKSCSLLKGDKTYVNNRTWKSSAYGFMTIATLEAEGRLCIDMFSLIKRDHKLDRYTLDFVSKHFLGRGKHDVSAKQMFEIYAEAQSAADEYKKAKAGQNKEDLDKATERVKQSNKKMGIVGAYCLEDSILCIDLFGELNTWIMLIELSSIVQVTVMSIFTRGQQIRVQNQVYQFAYREDVVLDERPGSRDGFSGGAVVDPRPGKYKYILIFDFASLYPSIIRAFNICFSTLVPPESNIPDSMCHVLQWTEEEEITTGTGANKKVTKQTKTYRYRFIKQQYYHGILPRICEHLVTERNKTKAKINPKNNSIINLTLKMREQGLKVSANSVFGALGVKEGKMPLPEGSRCICAMGRELIGMAGTHLKEKHNGNIVYGDTDSVMVDLQIKDPHDCVTRGEELSKEISALYPAPLKLEFERALYVGFFIKKKKYAGVSLAIIKYKPGDKVERIPFDPNYQNDDLVLLKVTIVRDGKTSIKYVGMPKECDPLRLSIGESMEVMDVKDGVGTYQIGKELRKGRVFIAGLPLDLGGAPNTSPEALLKKGIVLARRDNCLWIRKAYLSVLLNILFDKPLRDTLNIIDSEIMKMMTRQIAFTDMMITREIGSNYKPNSSYPLKLFSDELRRQGHPIQGGERIDIVFVRCEDDEKNAKQGYKMRLSEMYWQNSDREPLDKIHYVEKVLQNPVEQILYLGYKKEIDEVEVKCTPQIRRRKKIYTYLSAKYIKTWVKLIKAKEDLTNMIKQYKPHYPKQDPMFTHSFFGPPALEIVA